MVTEFVKGSVPKLKALAVALVSLDSISVFAVWAWAGRADPRDKAARTAKAAVVGKREKRMRNLSSTRPIYEPQHEAQRSGRFYYR